jgi:hypothetical protein
MTVVRQEAVIKDAIFLCKNLQDGFSNVDVDSLSYKNHSQHTYRWMVTGCNWRLRPTLTLIRFGTVRPVMCRRVVKPKQTNVYKTFRS